MAIKFLNTVQVDTDVLYVDASSNKVGIGTTSPGNYKLAVAGYTGIGDSLEVSDGLGGDRTLVINAPSGAFEIGDIDGIADEAYIVGDGENIKIFNGGSLTLITDSNRYVGIGTTNPQAKLHVQDYTTGESHQAMFKGGSVDIGDYSYISLNGGYVSDYGKEVRLAAVSESSFGNKTGFAVLTSPDSGGASGHERLRVTANGEVGIGTTSPNSKLQVDGEIDANGGDGYRINGKPWAAESSNNLRLGDWDGEAFTTSIFDENSAEILTIGNYGTMINCSSLTSSFGTTATLAVGTAGATSSGAAVITLSNSDTTGSAGDATGIIQFAMKDDNSNILGYTSASIQGSISQAPGSGNGGGGILDFKTAHPTSGSSPQPRMRINQLGQVGIGVTSIGTGFALDVSGEIHSSTYVSATAGLGVDNTSGQLGRGISLYGGPTLYPQYGLLFAQTVDLGTYGGVSGDWATYMTMSGTATRGWIWKAGTVDSTSNNVASISGAGQLTLASTATATNFILSSDETLKDNIKEIDTKHIDVDWKNFELKSEPGIKRAGVIAQELEIKHPEFVRTADDGLKSVAYIDLLITKIAELEARLEKLEK